MPNLSNRGSLAEISTAPNIGGQHNMNIIQKQLAHDGMEHMIQEKDQTINQLRETVEILELKIKKLEQLVKLKDAKIGNLTNKMNSIGIM